MLHRASKHSKVQTTICPFKIVPRRNRLVHRRYLVKSKLCNVTGLSALYQVGFSQPFQTSIISMHIVWTPFSSMPLSCNYTPTLTTSQNRKEQVMPWMILPLTKNFPRLMEKTRVISVDPKWCRPTLMPKMTLLKKN